MERFLTGKARNAEFDARTIFAIFMQCSFGVAFIAASVTMLRDIDDMGEVAAGASLGLIFAAIVFRAAWCTYRGVLLARDAHIVAERAAATGEAELRGLGIRGDPEKTVRELLRRRYLTGLVLDAAAGTVRVEPPKPSELAGVICEHCGASFEAEIASPNVKCPYCGMLIKRS